MNSKKKANKSKFKVVFGYILLFSSLVLFTSFISYIFNWKIDQSNVEWRRAINTANTAAINAANQTNAANILGLSNYAVNALWQQWRDEASWANTSAQNELNRNHNIAVAAMERAMTFDIMDQESRDNLISTIGAFAVRLWNSYPGEDDAEGEGE